MVTFHLFLISGLSSGDYVLHPPFGVANQRGAAADLVSRLLEKTNFGLELFFVISGFVLALPFLSARLGDGKPVSLKSYYLRRLTRIEPPYVVMLTVIFALLLLRGYGEGTSHYLAGLAYVHQLVFGESNRLNSVAWSLEIEVQFYCLLPLLVVVFCDPRPRVRRLMVMLVATLAVALQLQGLRSEPRLSTLIVNVLPFFLAGWLLADVYLFDWGGTPTERRDGISCRSWDGPFSSLGSSRGRPRE